MYISGYRELICGFKMLTEEHPDWPVSASPLTYYAPIYRVEERFKFKFSIQELHRGAFGFDSGFGITVPVSDSSKEMINAFSICGYPSNCSCLIIHNICGWIDVKWAVDIATYLAVKLDYTTLQCSLVNTNLIQQFMDCGFKEYIAYESVRTGRKNSFLVFSIPLDTRIAVLKLIEEDNNIFRKDK